MKTIKLGAKCDRRNARFWYWHNGDWVKLTLRPGELISFDRWHRHEEGSSWSETTFTYENGLLRSSLEEDGTDCDGRLQSSRTCECHLDQLTDCEVYRPEGTREELVFAQTGYRLGKCWVSDADVSGSPAWTKVSASQRDHSAERMGY